MDIIESAQKSIQEKLKELEKYLDDEADEYQETQSMIKAVLADKDKNLGRILDQQAQIKMIIDRDGRIMQLKKTIVEDSKTIDTLRRTCAVINMNALKNRQELLEDQSSEIEKFQMQQLKSIADDYRRHQDILGQRKKEIENLKKETENEDKNRAAYLEDVEKKLEKSLQTRQQLRQGLGEDIINPTRGGHFDELHDPNYCELTSVDEFTPYGNTATTSRNTNGSTRRGTRARNPRQRR